MTANASQSNSLFLHRLSNHRPLGLPEVGPTVDRPIRIGPDSLMGSINHGFSRSGQWFERSRCQPSKADRIIIELDAIRRGDGSGDLIDHRSSR